MEEKKSLFASIKEKATDLKESHDEKVQAKIEARNVFLEENKDNLQLIFKATSKFENIQIDEVSNLFKIKGAKTASFDKKNSKLGGAALFMMTGGASAIVGAANKGLSKIGSMGVIGGVYRFTDLLAFELLEDDSQVTKGGLGMAAIGGIALGPAGAVVGGITGKKKTKKIIESMMIKITVNDIDNPMLIIPLIEKSTKISSNDYKIAHTKAHKILSYLMIITAKAEQQLSPELLKQLQQADNNESIEIMDPYEELKKLKDLLDLEIINQEEFDKKKQELLGI